MTIALPRSIYALSAPLPSQEYAAATFDHGLAEERSPAMPDADVLPSLQMKNKIKHNTISNNIREI